MEAIQNIGSVDDIKCHLQHMNPVKPSEIKSDLAYLNYGLDYEIKHKDRSSVIQALKSKINKLKKLLP